MNTSYGLFHTERFNYGLYKTGSKISRDKYIEERDRVDYVFAFRIQLALRNVSLYKFYIGSNRF